MKKVSVFFASERSHSLGYGTSVFITVPSLASRQILRAVTQVNKLYCRQRVLSLTSIQLGLKLWCNNIFPPTVSPLLNAPQHRFWYFLVCFCPLYGPIAESKHYNTLNLSYSAVKERGGYLAVQLSISLIHVANNFVR